MLTRKLGILFLVTCLILITVPDVLGDPSAPVVYVSGDRSGDFNCDGKDDHVQINQALAHVAENSGYTTVYLKGPFTYVIDETLLIGSNTILEGDSSAKIKLVSNAGWIAWKPMIKERSFGSHDITIRGFTIDGNREENTNIASGKDYYNLIHLTGCKNINVYNMHLTNNHGNGLKTDKCTNVKFYNNEVYLLGHNGLYASSCSGVEAYNNEITCRTNSALRLYNSNKASFYDNVITSEGFGGVGIEIQKYGTSTMDDIEVYNNVIYKTALAGIWIFGSGSYPTSAANVYIHHNRIYDTGTKSSNSIIGGIVSDGFSGLIENNVIDGAYGAGIVQKNVYSSAPSGSGYVLTVKNNIITNTRSGPGISNSLTGTHSFFLKNNCFYGNTGRNYNNVKASSSDIAADPQYVDRSNHNYRLKSTSPAIDTGVYAETAEVEAENTTSTNDQTTVNKTSVTEIEEVDAENATVTNDQTIATEIVPEQEIDTPTAEENSTGIIIDNRLIEDSPDIVYQNKSYLDIGGRPGVGKYRELLLFDLSAYKDAEISNATFSLYWFYPDGQERPEDAVIEVYRPATSWNSENVTWNSRDNGILWAQPGGDWFDKNNVSQGDIPFATITLNGTSLPDNRYYELNVTDLVKEYVSGRYENTGFLIKTHTEDADYVAFYSSDIENEDKRPKLSIEKKAEI